MQDWHTFAYYSEQLLPLERGEDREETLNNLVFAFIQLLQPALAWQYAHELLIQHPDSELKEQVRSLVETAEPLLWQEIEETMGDTGFNREEKFELRIMHDRVRFLTEAGHAAEAIGVAEQLLEKIPTMLPILNNLSLSQFMLGNVDQAIATAQKVLDQDPENFHALGNLVRYHFLTAQFDPAQAYAQQLQQIESDTPDVEMKQAEAFAFLGDDEKVWAVYEKAKAKAADLNPVLLHLAAVASYRLGNEKTAWQLWQQAVKQQPSLEMAQQSLAEKRLPVGKRTIAWYWPFHYWFPQDFRQLMERHLGRNVQRMGKKGVERAMTSLLAERPYLTQLFPHILERGNRQAREFVLHFIRVVETPELLQLLYDFAQSPHGSDDLRLEAIQFISQHHPAMLPEDKQVPMWINGRQTELFMLGFEITNEPELVEGVSEAILDKYEVTYELLMEDKVVEAEPLLHEIIAEAPEFYSAYNQLAVVYEKQGRRQEARKLVEETHERFPDYLFARVALARMKIQEKRIEEARDLLKPMLMLPRLHISEFRALARAQMDLALANNQPESARAWLKMWQQVEEDNPEITEWAMRIDGPGQLLAGLQNLIGRGRNRR
ncbi:MAG: tetratricopeptide repeat protein [Anaerolineaceae bacterium]|nr:tetratricopeptide repeat protein [Anaerolineaceae bacterium]